MPPWPGLPPNPKAEGHYFIVNKNLIEMIACLVLVIIPSGHWIGLDALFFGARRRRRLAPTPPERPAIDPGRSPEQDRPGQPRTTPIASRSRCRRSRSVDTRSDSPTTSPRLPLTTDD